MGSMPRTAVPSSRIQLPLAAWLLLAATSAPALESLKWDAEQVVDDPYIINQLDFITLHAVNIAADPVTISDVHPSCSCIAYMPDETHATTITQSGSATLKFLVMHDGQPERSQKLIALRVSSSGSEQDKQFTIEIRTPLAPSMTPSHREWTRGIDDDRWQSTAIVAPAGHPEFRALRLIADAKTIEAKLEDDTDADGHPLAGRQTLSVRPLRPAPGGTFSVDAVVMTSAGERALRLLGTVKEKSEKQVQAEF
jgi:hypothetical protein